MHVGMNRFMHLPVVDYFRVPHARGDEPIGEPLSIGPLVSSPCTWG